MKKGRNFIQLILLAGIIVSAAVACDLINDPGEDPVDPGTVQDVDGNTYNTVEIGTQTWMQSDLKVTKFNDGTPIAHVLESESWGSTTAPAYCWYDNESPVPSNPYGALYNGYAVSMGTLCPKGWHVPSVSELEELAKFCGPDSGDAPRKLKEAGRSHWEENPETVTNETGFTALPTGRRVVNGAFYIRGKVGHWWTNTTIESRLKGMSMSSSNAPVYFSIGLSKPEGRSVRCIMD